MAFISLWYQSLPVLLMSGERDPVTPPQYASQTAETFPNSLNLVARGQAHSVMKNVCLRDITTEFIEQGTVEDLDTVLCGTDPASTVFYQPARTDP